MGEKSTQTLREFYGCDNQSTFSHTSCLRKECNEKEASLSCHPCLHRQGGIEGQWHRKAPKDKTCLEGVM